MIIKSTLIALTFAAMTAPTAFAKGHDQGMSKGETVMTVTVPTAKLLGSIKGNGR